MFCFQCLKILILCVWMFCPHVCCVPHEGLVHKDAKEAIILLELELQKGVIIHFCVGYQTQVLWKTIRY